MTAAEALLDQLRRGGAVLAQDRGDLVVEGPEVLLTDELIAEMRVHKTELIELTREGIDLQWAVVGCPRAPDSTGRDVGLDTNGAISAGSRGRSQFRPRPGKPPAAWGLTRSFRVVELARRRPADEARDPLTHVVGEGWPDWERLDVEVPSNAARSLASITLRSEIGGPTLLSPACTDRSPSPGHRRALPGGEDDHAVP